MNMFRRAAATELLLSPRSSSRKAIFCLPYLMPQQQNQQSPKPYYLCSTVATSNGGETKNSIAQMEKATQLDIDIENGSLEKVKEQAPGISWPRPRKIPWQARVSNSVNLIGRVQIPVHFETSADGKYWAGTIISQRRGDSPASPPFWIPIFFEGDEAHVAAKHLKPNDFIHIAGHLSADPPPFSLSEGQANVQVIVSTVNFVEWSSEMKKAFTPHNRKELVDNGSNNVLPMDMLCGTEKGKRYVTSLRSATSGKEDFAKTWQELLENPKQWWDNREKKLNGLLKPKHPDFKHKDSGVSLWLNTAPKWVLPQLDTLQSDFKLSNEKECQDVKGLDSWKKLVESPNEWWDNRTEKKSAKSPDFKHKFTGEVLWLNSSPAWVLPKLPPLKVKEAPATDAAFG